MTPTGATALEQALALHRAPRGVGGFRQAPLPAGVERLLHIAAGDGAEIGAAATETGEAPALVREAAVFYLQQVLFDADADSFRVLGANPDADDAQLRRHHRWLMRWLHPDRNRSGWETVFADRVNAAWNDIRTEDRRRAYRASGHVRHVPPTAAAAHWNDAKPDADDDPGAAATQVSGRTLRRVPALVLGAMVLVSVAGLVVLQRIESAAEPQDPPIAAVPREAPVTVASDAAGAAVERNLEEEVERLRFEQSIRAAPGVEAGATSVAAPVDDTLATTTLPPVASPSASATDMAPVPPESAPPPPSLEAPEVAATALSAPARAPTVSTAPSPRMATPRVAPAPPQPSAMLAAAAPRVSADPMPERSRQAVQAPAPPLTAAVATGSAPPPRPATPAPDSGQRIARTAAPASMTPPRAAAPPAAPVPAATPPVATATLVPATRAAPRPAPPPPAATAVVASWGWMDQARAQGLVERFSDRYERGDFAGLRGLFVAEPDRQLRGTLRDYERVIAGSDYRRIAFDHVSWLANTGSASIIGNYTEIVVLPGAPQGAANRGTMRFDVRDEAGEPRIFRLRQEALP